ncbi:MAG: hypothetical protein ABJA80_01110 [bacterium]
MPATQLDDILDALDQHHQRATYGAVAAIVGSAPRTLLRGRQRDPRHSWIVNHRTGLPTGYAAEQLHPHLTTLAAILGSREDLERWLELRRHAEVGAEHAA